MPFQLGLPEVIVVLVIALLFLGPKRLPEAGRSLGHGIREFKAGMSDTNHGTDPAAPQALLNPAHHSYSPPISYTRPASYTPPIPAPVDPAAPTSA
jgi:sec-independent protein translocase protein TatA